MNKIETNKDELIKDIKRNDLYEIIFKYNHERLTEKVMKVAFGKYGSKDNNLIYITLLDTDYISLSNKNEKYDILKELTFKNISEGIEIILLECDGEIISKYELEDCFLKDIAEIKLDYNNDNIYKSKEYIIPIEYSKIYKYII